MTNEQMRLNIYACFEPNSETYRYLEKVFMIEDSVIDASQEQAEASNYDAYRFTALEHAGKTGWSNPDAVITAAEMYLTFLKGGEVESE